MQISSSSILRRYVLSIAVVFQKDRTFALMKLNLYRYCMEIEIWRNTDMGSAQYVFSI